MFSTGWARAVHFTFATVVRALFCVIQHPDLDVRVALEAVQWDSFSGGEGYSSHDGDEGDADCDGDDEIPAGLKCEPCCPEDPLNALVVPKGSATCAEKGCKCVDQMMSGEFTSGFAYKN